MWDAFGNILLRVVLGYFALLSWSFVGQLFYVQNDDKKYKKMEEFFKAIVLIIGLWTIGNHYVNTYIKNGLLG